MSKILFIVGVAPFALLGVAHLAGTLRDLTHPSRFAPVNTALIPLLQETKVIATASARGAQSMWRTWLGANLTHGVGLLAFALFPILIALHDEDLLTDILALQPLVAAVGLAYTVIAFRFWFLPAGLAAGLGTACLVVTALI